MSSSGPLTHPTWRWEPWQRPSISHLSLGGDRYVDEPEPLPERRPVGFVQHPPEVDPLLWEGDDA